MSSINFHTKEISVKIVYYGPGLCGKTTSLHTIYNSLPEDRRPQLVSLATEVDRTIFFDFLPVTAYRIRDFIVRLQLYTVPGQVFYNATRKLVLNGVDGILFVLDSQTGMKDSNLESMQNLEDNLAELGLETSRVPMVLQYNKRDLSDIFTIEEMESLYNRNGLPAFSSIATRGDGLLEALKSISQMVVNDLVHKGLGRQLTQPASDTPTSTATSVNTDTTTIGAAPRSVEEAVSRAAVPTEHRSSIGLWPVGDIEPLGAQIEAALRTANWQNVILAIEQLVQLQARKWAASEGLNKEDPFTHFLLMRGIAPARYRALWEASKALRAGQTVGRAEAMSALVLALETLW
ncbi:MAG: GTPase [Deltaproteobacteria bacterium]|nr:GTPase [Deltaproteobacteria bacterium]